MKPVETCRNRQISVAVCTCLCRLHIYSDGFILCLLRLRLRLPVFPVQGDFRLEGIYHFLIVPAVFLSVFLLNGIYR